MPPRYRICTLFAQFIALESDDREVYFGRMLSDAPTGVKAAICIRTLRLKVKPEARAWLNAAAIEVNRVWNFVNETSAKAARPFAGVPKWLSGYDLDKLTAGAAQYFERIGSETIQRVNAEFATRRKQFKRTKLRWRSSRGSRRALGWVPFKAVQLKRKGKSLRFSGKTFRLFEQERLAGVSWKCGSFSQDSVGDWWLNVPVEYPVQATLGQNEEVGLDLGLKDTVATSDEDKLEAGHFYRNIKRTIAQAQRRGHQRQAKRLHRRAARRRKDVTRACSNCGALTGPTGLDMLAVRTWVCSGCGGTHDRDVNAARNILFAARCSPSVSGNESSPSAAPPSQASRLRKAGKSALAAAA
jgi:hypothetical protein